MEPKIFSFFSFFGFFSFSENFQFPDSRAAGRVAVRAAGPTASCCSVDLDFESWQQSYKNAGCNRPAASCCSVDSGF